MSDKPKFDINIRREGQKCGYISIQSLEVIEARRRMDDYCGTKSAAVGYFFCDGLIIPMYDIEKDTQKKRR